MKSCRCCLGQYNKQTGFYTELSNKDTKAEGFCDFCNRNDEKWYMPNKKCHNKDATGVCPDGHKEFIYGHCSNCGAIEEVIKYHEQRGYFFDGKVLHEISS